MKTDIGDWTGEIHQGDAIEVMDEMPPESVDCVIFSPPYWGLRDYGEDVEKIWGGDEDCNHIWKSHKQKPRGGLNTEDNPPDVGGNKHTQETRLRGEGVESDFCSECGAWKGQFGLEPSPHMYVDHLVEVGRSVHRVLKDTGTWWLNLGDTYSGGGGIAGVPDDWDSASTDNRDKYPESVPARDTEFPDKCKLLMPHRTAISLIDDGWICRNDAVWAKPNPMPESVTDRLSTTFEFFFMFSKQQKYYFDLDSIKKPYKSDKAPDAPIGGYKHQENMNPTYDGNKWEMKNGKNPGDVFNTGVAKFADAHFATFPPELIETPIKASCPEKVCNECGSPYERDIEKEKVKISDSPRYSGVKMRNDSEDARYDSLHHHKGWGKSCSCHTEETKPGVVLDPFMGSGTTAMVAENLQRDWVGIDLNPEYVDISWDRIEKETDYNTNPISEW